MQSHLCWKYKRKILDKILRSKILHRKLNKIWRVTLNECAFVYEDMIEIWYKIHNIRTCNIMEQHVRACKNMLTWE